MSFSLYVPVIVYQQFCSTKTQTRLEELWRLLSNAKSQVPQDVTLAKHDRNYRYREQYDLRDVYIPKRTKIKCKKFKKPSLHVHISFLAVSLRKS